MKRNKITYLVLTIMALSSFSCKKFTTIEPTDLVRTENTMKTSTDAITVINGLYGLMQPLTDQIFLAAEAQGDLVVAARGADKYIREIAENRVTSSNPYTDYTKFYTLIIACNQALKGFAEIAKIDPVYSKDVYGYNIAEVTYIRAWTYLQLIKIWGDVPYVEDGVVTADKIRNLTPVSSDMIVKKIAKQCADNFDEMQFLNIDALSVNDRLLAMGQFTNVSSRIFLAELYVYANDWENAWNTIKVYDEGLENDGSRTRLNFFGGRWDNWHQAFDRNNVNAYWNIVAMSITYDGSKNQFNSLIKWTGNKNGAIYALKPSANAINNWKTADFILQIYQTTSRGFYFEEGGAGTGLPANDVLNADGTPVIVKGAGDFMRGEKGSYLVDGKDTLIFKYIAKARGIEKSLLINDKYSDNDAFFNLYRDANIGLLTSEIYNHRNLPGLALQQINGITTYAYVMRGTRNRVGVAPLVTDPNGGNIMKQVDKLILEEAAMETAFDGRRWSDLVRIAKRYPEDPDFLGQIIAKKYPAAKQADIIARLRDQHKWYFPVYTGNTKAN